MFTRLLLAALLSLLAEAAGVRAYTEDFPPYNYADSQGRPAGYAVEVLGLLMNEAGVDYQLELLPWARALSLARQQPDHLIFTIARTPAREAHFFWIGPFARRSTALMRLRSTPHQVASLAEARAWRTGVINGDAGMEMLLAQGFVRGRNLVPVSQRNDLIRLLQARSIDFVVASPTIMQHVARRAGMAPDELVVQLQLGQAGDGFYFALNRQSDPALVRKLQQAFAQLQARHALEPLKRRYQIE